MKRTKQLSVPLQNTPEATSHESLLLPVLSPGALVPSCFHHCFFSSLGTPLAAFPFFTTHLVLLCFHFNLQSCQCVPLFISKWALLALSSQSHTSPWCCCLPERLDCLLFLSFCVPKFPPELHLCQAAASHLHISLPMSCSNSHVKASIATHSKKMCSLPHGRPLSFSQRIAA